MRRFVQVLSVDLAAKIALGLVAVLLIRFMPTDEYAALTLAISVATLAAQLLAAGFNRIYIVGFDRLQLAGRAEPYLMLQIAFIGMAGCMALPVSYAFQGLYGAAVALAAAIILSEFSKTYYQRDLRFGAYSAIEIGRAATQALAILGLIWLYGRNLPAKAVVWVQAGALEVGS